MLKGYKSCKVLLDLLKETFGHKELELIGEFDSNYDSFGWKFKGRCKILYSISTEGGTLPEGVYDLLVTYSGDSELNGEIYLEGEFRLREIIEKIKAFREMEKSDKYPEG